MKTKLLVLTVAALATASCGEMMVMGGKKPIVAPAPITVTVQENAGNPTTCTITAPAKNDEIHVPPGTWTLTWNLQGPAAYQFDQNVGITFPGSGSPLSNPAVTARSFSLTDNNTPSTRGTFPYHIHVEKPGTPGTPKVQCKLDPSVINDDGSSYQ